MKDKKQQSRKDFEKSIILNAWNDPEYKKRLLADPKKVFLEELQSIDENFTLPDNMNVKVLEEDPNTLYLVLPQDPQPILQKIQENILDSAAGGSVVVALNTNTQTNSLYFTVAAVNANTNVAVYDPQILLLNVLANANTNVVA